MTGTYNSYCCDAYAICKGNMTLVDRTEATLEYISTWLGKKNVLC